MKSIADVGAYSDNSSVGVISGEEPCQEKDMPSDLHVSRLVITVEVNHAGRQSVLTS